MFNKINMLHLGMTVATVLGILVIDKLFDSVVAEEAAISIIVLLINKIHPVFQQSSKRTKYHNKKR